MASRVLICLGLLCCFWGQAQRRYPLTYHRQDSGVMQQMPKVQFAGKDAALRYLAQWPALMAASGHWAASVDSLKLDSTAGEAWIYHGPAYAWDRVMLDSTAKAWQAGLPNFKTPASKRAPVPAASPSVLPVQLLDYLQKNGYPFAEVQWDSMRLDNDKLSGILRLRTGPLYKIDSIVQLGKARVKSSFLHRYLSITRGMPYNQLVLDDIDRRLADLPFVTAAKPWDLQMLGTGGLVNVYLEPRRSNIINVLLGAMPVSTQTPGNKLQITGDVNLLMRNPFGGGETMELTWQQIQYRSPRLHLGYQQPYLLGGKAGMDFSFDLLRKDTQFLNLGLLVGVPYEVTSRSTAKVFYQLQQTIVSYTDTAFVLINRQLPDLADVTLNSLGLDYTFNSTDFRFNPRKGSQMHILAFAGLKKIKPNSAIGNLKDPADPGYDFGSLYDTVKQKTYLVKASMQASRFWPLGTNTVLKLAMNGGWMQSGNYYRNELFQIGGFKLLRGFDEESIYARGYAVATAEWRLMAGQASYFYGFADLGWAQYKDVLQSYGHGYLGMGLGLAIQTGNSQVNISWAAGKRNDLPLDLRQSKIHLGFVNFF